MRTRNLARMPRWATWLAAGILMAWATLAAADDWPGWRGPHGDGKSRETGLLKQWPDGGPKVLWEAPLGRGYSSIAVAGGRVFTMFQDDQGQYVAAFAEADGKPLWKTRTGGVFTCDTGHNGPRSTPLVDGPRVYAIDGNGEVVCLAAEDGKILWQKNMLQLAGAQNIHWGIAQSPWLHGDKLIVNPGGNNGAAIMALNKMTGDVIWKTANGLAGYSTPVACTAGGVEQIVVFGGDTLYGVAPADGKVLWTFPWKTSNDVNAATPIVWDDMIFISSGYRRGAAVVKVDPAADPPVTKLWENTNLQCHIGTPILTDGMLYGYQERILTCVDFRTGERKWLDRINNQSQFPPKGQITWAEGLYYILGENGTLALARLTPEGGEKISQIAIMPGAERWATPVIANGRLYLRDDRRLVCLDIREP